MIIIGIVYGAFTGRMAELSNAAIESAKDAVSLCITMLGIVSLWVGLMEIAKSCGLIEKLTKMLKCHMGGWNTNNYSDVVLPKPKNKLENFVHMCDFLASRKVINVKFNDINISEE